MRGKTQHVMEGSEMKAKEYLSRLKIMRAESDRISLEITDIEKAREKVMTAEVLDQVQITELSNRLVDLYCRYVELKEKYFTTYEEIMSRILAMPGDVERNVLYMRYVQGCSFRTISDSLMYVEKYVMNAHGRALQKFGQIWKTELDAVPSPPL